MDYRFTPEQDAFRQEVRDFLQRELPPEIFHAGRPPESELFDEAMAFRRKLGEKRWIGIGWPREYGGLGATPIMQMIFHEEILYHNAPLDGQAYQVGPAIIAHGSEYLKKKFLDATARQDILWCQGFSEPNAGSDLASLRTRAEEDGDEYVINGSKIWTSHAHRADWMHVLTRTDPEAPKHKGISYFILDMKTPGITTRALHNMAGEHHFNEIFFDNVRVPKRNMIGERNQGWYVAMTTLGNERSGIRDVARARRQLDELLGVVREDRVPGLRRDPVAVNKLADLAVAVAVAQKLSYRTAWMDETRQAIVREGSMAKNFATELQQRIAYVSLELLGLYSHCEIRSPHALRNGFFPYYLMSTVRATISAGTAEINRNVIATRGLGLPR